MTKLELKAQAYDCIVRIETYTQRLQELNKKIMEPETNPVPEEVTPETTPEVTESGAVEQGADVV